MTARDPARTVLILGGYGVFGGRVARLLAADPAVRIIVAGRSADKAADFAGSLKRSLPGATVDGLALDIGADLPDALRAAEAGIVVHAAGPFQGQDYAVAQACIDTGIDYVDLADGRGFVSGFSALDSAARDAGMLAVTGASTVPGLSSAAVDRLTAGLTNIESIAIGITPGNRAPRGRAVVEAIVGTAGRKMPRWTEGRFAEAPAWSGLRRYRLAVPGPGKDSALGQRWFSAYDVPDLELFPERYAVSGSVTFEAGLELGLLHLGFWALAWPVRLGLIRSLAPLAPLLHRTARLFEPFGTDRGGMFVTVRGTDADGRKIARRWTLIAEAGHGPLVPAIPAAILVRKRIDRSLTGSGAKPCLGLFDLAAFDSVAADFNIRTAIEDV